MPLWEYCKIDLNDVGRRNDDIDALRDAGKDGWELVSIGLNNIANLKRATPKLDANSLNRKKE